jgi:hypothetical protein
MTYRVQQKVFVNAVIRWFISALTKTHHKLNGSSVRRKQPLYVVPNTLNGQQRTAYKR